MHCSNPISVNIVPQHTHRHQSKDKTRDWIFKNSSLGNTVARFTKKRYIQKFLRKAGGIAIRKRTVPDSSSPYTHIKRSSMAMKLKMAPQWQCNGSVLRGATRAAAVVWVVLHFDTPMASQWNKQTMHMPGPWYTIST